MQVLCRKPSQRAGDRWVGGEIKKVNVNTFEGGIYSGRMDDLLPD